MFKARLLSFPPWNIAIAIMGFKKAPTCSHRKVTAIHLGIPTNTDRASTPSYVRNTQNSELFTRDGKRGRKTKCPPSWEPLLALKFGNLRSMHLDWASLRRRREHCYRPAMVYQDEQWRWRDGSGWSWISSQDFGRDRRTGSQTSSLGRVEVAGRGRQVGGNLIMMSTLPCNNKQTMFQNNFHEIID